MSSIPEFIRTEQNGIEYFTIVATGESGMSQSGLARACGISRQSIIKLVDDLNPVTKTPSECLEPSADKDLNPVTKAHSESLEPSADKDLHPVTKAPSGGLTSGLSQDVRNPTKND